MATIFREGRSNGQIDMLGATIERACQGVKAKLKNLDNEERMKANLALNSLTGVFMENKMELMFYENYEIEIGGIHVKLLYRISRGFPIVQKWQYSCPGEKSACLCFSFDENGAQHSPLLSFRAALWVNFGLQRKCVIFKNRHSK